MKAYVAIVDGDNVTLYSAEVVETNLVEVGGKIRGYKFSEQLPNWLVPLLARKEKTHERRRNAS